MNREHDGILTWLFPLPSPLLHRNLKNQELQSDSNCETSSLEATGENRTVLEFPQKHYSQRSDTI